MINFIKRDVWLTGLALAFSAAAFAAQPAGGSSGAPGTPTPTPYGQAPTAAVYGAPSTNTGSAPLLPALPKINSAPAPDQGLPQLRQPQPPLRLPKSNAGQP